MMAVRVVEVVAHGGATWPAGEGMTCFRAAKDDDNKVIIIILMVINNNCRD